MKKRRQIKNQGIGARIMAVLFLAWAWMIPQSSLAFDFDESRKGPRFEINLDYAQATHFVSAFQALQNVGESTQELQRVLQDNYGKNEDAVAKFSLGAYDLTVTRQPSLFQKAYFEIGGDISAWGIMQNPVISELRARAVGIVSASVGFMGQLPSSGLRTRLGLVGGAGVEKRTDLIGPDLRETIDLDTGRVRMYGVDLGVATPSDPKRDVQAGAALEYHGTYFVTDLDGTVLANRWKSYSYLEVGNPARRSSLVFRPHLIFGTEPLPVELLPRSWDLIHRESRPSELEAWAGAGADLGFFFAPDAGLNATAGYYGGFAGGQVSLEMNPFLLKAGTWGLSLGPGFRNESERIWSGSLGLRF